MGRNFAWRRFAPVELETGYALIWTNAAAARLVLKVAPHLRVKSTQARELMRFQNHLQACRRRRDQLGRLIPLSPRQREIRESFHRRLKSLNRRGPTIPHSRSARSLRHASRKVSAEYLAGFTDAEGSLILAKVSIFDKWNLQYVPRVCIDNTNKAVLEDLQRDYGGILANQVARKAQWKRAYKLVWNGRKIKPLLLSVGPHLRIKRTQARILMQFIRHRKRTHQRRTGRCFGRFPPGVIAYRESLYQRMKKENARGISSGGNGKAN